MGDGVRVVVFFCFFNAQSSPARRR